MKKLARGLLLSVLSAPALAGCNQAPEAPAIVEAPPYSACAPHLEVTDANAMLNPGDCVVSATGGYILTMRPTGDLELIAPSAQGDTIIWSSHSSGGAPNSRYLGVQTDGNLVIYDAQGAPVWASGTGGRPGHYVLRVDDAGVAQLISVESSRAVWSVPQ